MLDKIYDKGEIIIKADEWDKLRGEIMDSIRVLDMEDFVDLQSIENYICQTDSEYYKIIPCDMTAVGLWVEKVEER